MISSRRMRCPQCNAAIAWDRLKAARGSFRCPHCDALLSVAESYARALVTMGLLGGCALAWITKVRVLLYPSMGIEIGAIMSLWAGFPIGFLMVTVLGRIVPFFVSVPLQFYRRSSVTTLDLDRDGQSETENSGRP